MPSEKLSNLFSQEQKAVHDLQMSRIQEAKERVDYYTVTPKGFKLLTMLSKRMDVLDAERKEELDLTYPAMKDRTSTPGWAEYLRLFHSATMLIRASSPSGLWINPVYEEEESEALEDLIEGGYIIRGSE